MIGRDHLDCGSVASPYRETEAMKDGSDAIADWPILNALVNTAAGATWVSFHHGGGVGIGYSLHAGMVVVADGTDAAARALERVLTSDPGMGVMRHARRRLRRGDRRRAGDRPRPARDHDVTVALVPEVVLDATGVHRDLAVLVDADDGMIEALIGVAHAPDDAVPEITIGETLADLDDPRPLPLITVDEPAISMTIGINTSPMAGRVKGAKVTARLVKDRLDRELVGNVSMRVLPTERPDAWEVQGRGELALAILVEQMRREGYELTVGKPVVVTRVVDGKVHEPIERVTIDTPEEYLGPITQLLAARKGRLEQMTNHGTGWVRMEYLVPSRGLIGFRTQFLTDTRGTGIANHVFEGYEPWAGDISTRISGSLVADRSGAATAYAMANLQERGSMFIAPDHRGLRGHDRRRELPRRRHGRQHHQGEEAHQRALRRCRRPRAARAAAHPVARAVAGVLPRGRVRRGDPRGHPHPQGRARPDPARPRRRPGEEELSPGGPEGQRRHAPGADSREPSFAPPSSAPGLVPTLVGAVLAVALVVAGVFALGGRAPADPEKATPDLGRR